MGARHSLDCGILYSLPIRYKPWHSCHVQFRLWQPLIVPIQLRLWNLLFLGHKAHTLAFSPWSTESGSCPQGVDLGNFFQPMEYKLWLYSLSIRYRSWHPCPIEFRLWPFRFCLYNTDFNISSCLYSSYSGHSFHCLTIQTQASYFFTLMEFRLWHSDHFIYLVQFRLWHAYTSCPWSSDSRNL